MPMTSSKRDELKRKRGKLSRDAVDREPTPVTPARRRLATTRPGAARDVASHHGPRDPRFDYLTHSHD